MAAIENPVNQNKRVANPNKSSLIGNAFGHSLSAYFAIGDYKLARENGSSRIGAVASAATEFAIGELMGGWYFGYALAKGVPQAAIGATEKLGKMQRGMNKTSRQKPFQNAVFQDYNRAFTMRQAGMQAAQRSQYNLQQAIMGNEAQYLK